MISGLKSKQYIVLLYILENLKNGPFFKPDYCKRIRSLGFPKMRNEEDHT